jgi:hypothetical protein
MADQYAQQVLSGQEVRISAAICEITGAGLRPGDPVGVKQTGQCDVLLRPDGGTQYVGGDRPKNGEFIVPSPDLPKIQSGQRVVLTQSIASALAAQHATGLCAVAVVDPQNFRAVAGRLVGANCEAAMIPDNSDLSRASVIEAARHLASGAGVSPKMIVPPYPRGQHNLLGALAQSDGKHDAADVLIRRPLENAMRFVSGGNPYGLTNQQVSRAMSAGAEIGR